MPISGKKKEELTKEAILSHISTFDIYRHFLGDFKINSVICNKHRNETNPSLIVGNKFGELGHKDFGDYSWRGSCFDLVMQIYKCDYNTALRIVDKEFNLGISYQKIDNYSPINWTTPKETIIKPPPIIQVVTRNPTKQELLYWEAYHLSLDDLKRENIYFPKTIYRNKQKLPDSPLLTFIYLYPEIEKIKIYRPLAPKRTKDTPVHMWKWDNSVPFDYCDGLKDIKDCKYSFLTKSRKDRIVLRKILGTKCIADCQAEDPSCISENTIKHMKNNSEIQVTIFDNDKKGLESSNWLTATHDFKHCNVPFKLPDLQKGGYITDFSDMSRDYSPESVFNHFKSKQLI